MTNGVQENIRFYHQTWDGILNQGRLELVDSSFASDYVFEGPGVSLRGPEQAREYFGGFLTAFSDIQFVVEDIFGQDDKVVKRWVFQGTHTGELSGIEPTGNRITLVGATIARIVNGKIAEELDYYDNLGFLQQLGAIPSEG